LEKRRQQKQVRSLAFTIGGAALLVLGGVIAFFWLNSRQSNSVMPLGATVTPQTTLLSLTATTDRDPWRKLAGLGTADSKTRWQNQLKGFETDFLNPFGLTYDKDIRPWVGPQITLTLLSPAPEDAVQVGANAIVWFLPLRDAAQAQSVLARMGSTPQKRIYKDVEVQVFQGSNRKTVAITILEGRLLVASNGNITLNQIIDTYRGGPSLAQTPRLQEALNTIADRSSFAQLYVNLPIATAGVLQDAGSSIPKSTIEQVQAVQGFGSNITLTGETLNFKAISWLKPDAKQTLKSTNNSQTLARLLPADTLMTTSGSDFRQFWQDYSQGTESQLIVPLNPGKIQSGLQQSTGIDFEKEFVSWMGGEFIAAVVPTAAKPKQGVGVTLLVKASDRTQADRSFQKLDNAMRDRHNFLVATSKLGNRTVTTWKVPPNLPLASHGWLDNNVAFFTFGAPITDRIVTPPTSSLADAERFRSTNAKHLSPSAGYFYVDLPRAITLMQNSPLLPKLAPSVTQVAQAIEGIGLTAAVQNNWSTRYDLTVQLKR
jgi:hypothetical protein